MLSPFDVTGVRRVCLVEQLAFSNPRGRVHMMVHGTFPLVVEILLKIGINRGILANIKT
jgi:hypothetical protein